MKIKSVMTGVVIDRPEKLAERLVAAGYYVRVEAERPPDPPAAPRKTRRRYKRRDLEAGDE